MLLHTLILRAARPAQALLFPSLLLAAAAAQAEGRVYQWKDRNNVLHFSDTAPLSAQEVKPKPTSSGLDAGARLASSSVNEQVCAQKKAQLASFVSAGKVTETNALGETREYSEAERQKLIESTEDAVRAACGPG